MSQLFSSDPQNVNISRPLSWGASVFLEKQPQSFAW